MQINISLPRTDSATTPEEVRSFLRQLELSVHHAQKALKEIEVMEKEKGTENLWMSVLYRVRNVEDSGTGERCNCKLEHPYTDEIEIELYTM